MEGPVIDGADKDYPHRTGKEEEGDTRLMGIELFFFIWVIVLPILAITLAIVFPVFWFFIVPKVARRLTWARFGSSSVLAVADDAGWVELMVSRRGLPEGILQTKDDWRFLPRPKWKKGKRKGEEAELAQDIILQKYILKGLGKPFWFGYAGKAALINPATVAYLQGGQPNVNPDGYFTEIKRFADDLPDHFRKPLKKIVDRLHDSLKAKPIEYVDPRKAIKENLPQMYTPSQLKALATNRELYGMRKMGKQYTPLILGAGFILAMVIIAILLVTRL